MEIICLESVVAFLTDSYRENWAKECVSLPIYPNLMTHDIFRIVKEIKKFFNTK